MNRLHRRLSTFSHSRKASRSSTHGSSIDTASPVPHLLKSNAPPTEAETAEVRHAIDNVSTFLISTMADSDHGANPTEKAGPSEHGVLGTQDPHFVQKSTEFIRDHKALLSPLRRLPPEVLAAIFDHYISPFPSLDRVQYPWTPSHVCRAWREAALSHPHLWSHIHVDFCAWEKQRLPRYCFDFYKMLLERSAAAPLYVSVCCIKWTNPQVESFRPIVDLLASHSERWESFNLQCYIDLLEAFQSIKHRLLLLNYVNLAIHPDPKEIRKSVIDMFEVAPKLQVVHLSDSCLEFKLPWSQIIEFKDGTCWCNDSPLHNVLTQSNDISNLSARGITSNNLGLSRPRTSLPNLTSFDIHYIPLPTDLDSISSNDDSINSLLNSLTLPAVESIAITNFPVNPIPALSALLSRSLACTARLQNLALGTCLQTIPPGELTALLRGLDDLVKLSIAMPHSSDLEAFIVRPNQLVLLPHLESLHIGVSTPVYNLERTLNEIASTRFLESPEASVGLASPLLQMRLIFADAGNCHLSHERLEQDVSQYILRAHPRELQNIRYKLEKEIPQLSGSLPTTPSKLDLKINHAYKLAKVFNALEKHDVNDVHDLYGSSIHHAMYHVANVHPSSIPGEKIYHFQRRATALLKKWAVMLLADVPNRRWAFQGEHSIVYTPMFNPVRQDPDVLTFMIYGWKFSAYKYLSCSYDDMLGRLLPVD
ncbi:unnamed protein product [Cyclocybe aegerita]|uniref:F-box domain-containing protein n=1 Tax=Cyclocybe aegerita TaxID=1973307 RepID=A0A8S0XWT3_CYCAE|nr:unnamed protein product [Cyclocybe aegerita]